MHMRCWHRQPLTRRPLLPSGRISRGAYLLTSRVRSKALRGLVCERLRSRVQVVAATAMLNAQKFSMHTEAERACYTQ